jgi:hypothetical protein
MCLVQVHALYALLDEYAIKVPDVDRAGYATMDSSYAALKALLEDVEGNKDASSSKYSAELETGGSCHCFVPGHRELSTGQLLGACCVLSHTQQALLVSCVLMC